MSVLEEPGQGPKMAGSGPVVSCHLEQICSKLCEGRQSAGEMDLDGDFGLIQAGECAALQGSQGHGEWK